MNIDINKFYVTMENKTTLKIDVSINGKESSKNSIGSKIRNS